MGVFNVAAMHQSVVPILPMLVGSERMQGLLCARSIKTISGWLLVATSGTAAALTSAVASATMIVGPALLLRRGIDVG